MAAYRLDLPERLARTPVKLVAFGSLVQFRDTAGMPLTSAGAARMELLVPSGKTPDTVRIVLAAASK